MSELLEAMMVISFGISWPMSIHKSYCGRTTRGKSVVFLLFILFGYLCGIAAKLIAHNLTYVFFFYVLNATMVFIDLLLYIRNRRLDRLAAQEGKAE